MLTGITAALTGHLLYRSNSKPSTVGLVAAMGTGLVTSHLLEMRAQKNFIYSGYLNRNFTTKALLSAVGIAYGWWHHKHTHQLKCANQMRFWKKVAASRRFER